MVFVSRAPPNTYFLGSSRVQIPNSISIGNSAVFAQFTALRRQSRYTLQQAAPFPLKIVPSHGNLNPHPIHGSMGPTDSATQMIGSAVFAQFTTEHPYLITMAALNPPQNFTSRGRSGHSGLE